MGDALINGWWTAAEAIEHHPDLLNVDLLWTQYEPPSEEWDHGPLRVLLGQGVAAGSPTPADGGAEVLTAGYTDDVAQEARSKPRD